MSFKLSDRVELNVSTKSEEEPAVYIFNHRYNTDLYLPISRFKTLIARVNEIDQAVEYLALGDYVKFRRHIGSGYHVSIASSHRHIDIRRFYQDHTGNLCPTGDGLSLKLTEWQQLKDILPQIRDLIPNYDSILECSVTSSHQNQVGFLQCPECNPYDYTSW